MIYQPNHKNRKLCYTTGSPTRLVVEIKLVPYMLAKSLSQVGIWSAYRVDKMKNNLKKCQKCLEVKDIGEFYILRNWRNPSSNVYFHRSYCKGCWYERSKPYAKKSLEKNVFKNRCRALSRKAIKEGILVKSPCEVCGTENDVHVHHEDYTKPLEVSWLCRSHHEQLHHNLLPIKQKHDKQ